MRRYDLKFWRMRQGLTQSDVAAKLGISTGHYRGIENGRYDPSQKIINRFIDTFDVGLAGLEIIHNVKELFKKEEHD